MERFASFDPAERAVLFRQCAANRGPTSPVLVEKDFWVCWTLDLLFGLVVSPHLMFKGGTSLSKGYDLIERFSEDIDIAIERAILDLPSGFDLGSIKGSKARARALDGLDRATGAFVAEALLPQLRRKGEAVLAESHSLILDPKDLQTILFSYPPALERDDYGGVAYINPVVRIEFGSRSDHHPVEAVTVGPYTAEEFPSEFERPSCTVRAQAPARTFWEKATILHAENNRPPRDDIPRAWIRGSRHLSDLVMMGRRGVTKTALGNLELLADVARHKATFFGSKWARYEEACPGTLRLVPDGPYYAHMRRDYVDMEPMFFGPRPSFEEVVADLEALERQINEGE